MDKKSKILIFFFVTLLSLLIIFFGFNIWISSFVTKKINATVLAIKSKLPKGSSVFIVNEVSEQFYHKGVLKINYINKEDNTKIDLSIPYLVNHPWNLPFVGKSDFSGEVLLDVFTSDLFSYAGATNLLHFKGQVDSHKNINLGVFVNPISISIKSLGNINTTINSFHPLNIKASKFAANVDYSIVTNNLNLSLNSLTTELNYVTNDFSILSLLLENYNSTTSINLDPLLSNKDLNLKHKLKIDSIKLNNPNIFISKVDLSFDFSKFKSYSDLYFKLITGISKIKDENFTSFTIEADLSHINNFLIKYLTKLKDIEQADPSKRVLLLEDFKSLLVNQLKEGFIVNLKKIDVDSSKYKISSNIKVESLPSDRKYRLVDNINFSGFVNYVGDKSLQIATYLNDELSIKYDLDKITKSISLSLNKDGANISINSQNDSLMNNIILEIFNVIDQELGFSVKNEVKEVVEGKPDLIKKEEIIYIKEYNPH